MSAMLLFVGIDNHSNWYVLSDPYQTDTEINCCKISLKWLLSYYTLMQRRLTKDSFTFCQFMELALVSIHVKIEIL